MLTRDQILVASASRLRHETVDVPELGGEIMLWEMTGAERNAFDAVVSHIGKDPALEATWRTQLLVRSIKDAEGVPLFAAADLDRLGAALPGPVMVRLWDRAARLSAVTVEDVEDLRKNSVSGPGGGSASGSPNVSG